MTAGNNPYDIVQVEPDIEAAENPYAIVGEEPEPEPSWAERIGTAIATKLGGAKSAIIDPNNRPVGEALADIGTSVRANLAKQIAGMQTRELDELIAAYERTGQPVPPSLLEGRQAALGTAQEADTDLQLVNQRSTTLERVLQNSASSLATSAGALAVGMGARAGGISTPVATLAGTASIGPPTGGSTYIERIIKGDPREKADLVASIDETAEVVTELLPTARLLDGAGKTYLQKLLRYAVAELPGETAAHYIQTLNNRLADVGTSAPVNPGMVKEIAWEATKQLPEVWASVMLSGGLLVGASHLPDMARNRGQAARGGAGGPQGPEPAPDFPFDAYPVTEPPAQLEGWSGGPQPPPTYKAEGQPIYPSDATPDERRWFDIMWERSRPQNRSQAERERADQRADRTPPPDQPPPGGAGPSAGPGPTAPRAPAGGAPALPAPEPGAYDIVSVEPDASDSTGAGGSVGPRVLPPPPATPASVEPRQLQTPAANVQPPAAVSAPQQQSSDVAPTDERGLQRWLEERNREVAAVDEELRAHERETSRLASESLNEEWLPADRAARPARYAEAYSERYKRVQYERSGELEKIRARREALVKPMSEALSWHKARNSPGTLEPIFESDTRKSVPKGSRRESSRQLVRDRVSRESVGVVRYRAKKAQYTFEPAPKGDKELRAAMLEKFQYASWGDERQAADEIAQFAREWRAGKADRDRTIEGEATEVPGRTVDWRTSPEQAEELRKRLRGNSGNTPALNPPAEPGALSERDVEEELEGDQTGELAVVEGDKYNLTATRVDGRTQYRIYLGQNEQPVETLDSYPAGIDRWRSLEAEVAGGPKRAPANLEGVETEPRNVDARPIWPQPKQTVQIAKKAELETLTPQQAAARIQQWREFAKRIGKEEDHSSEVILSLFDASGTWSQPYLDAGYTVIRFDLSLGDDVMKANPYAEALEIKAAGKRVVGILAAPPCTSFSAAGARWWGSQHDQPSKEWVRKKYGEFAAEYFDRPLDYAVMLVAMTEQFVEQTDPSLFYVVENPVGRIQSEADLSDPRATFHPHHFGDPYTKKTLLWGEFKTDMPTANVEPTEGSRVHNLRGDVPEQKAQRSITPEGFAYAFFVANNTSALELERGAAADFEQRKAKAAAPVDHAAELRKAAPKSASVIPESRTKRKALICAMCSSAKDAEEGKIRAEERYAPGAVVSAMAKIPEHLRPDILFLSAEYGLIGHDTPIEHYEKKLTKGAADKLIRSKAAGEKWLATVIDYEGATVLVAAGGEYRRVFEAWASKYRIDLASAGVTIKFAPAEVGLMRGAIKQYAIDAQPSGTYRDFVEAKARKGEVRKEELSLLAKREPLRSHARALAEQLVEGGGISVLPDGSRTSSVNPEWAQALLESEKDVPVKRVKEIARKLEAGEKLGVVETRVANALLEEARSERAAQARGGYSQRKAAAIERRYMDILEAYTLQMDFGENPKEAEKLRAELDRLRKRYPAHFGINTAGGVAEPVDGYRVERPVEKGAWREGRVLNRDHIALLPAEKRALAEFLKGRKDRARILKMLEQHRGTPWAKQAVEGIFTRQAAIELMAGREPAFTSALDDPRAHKTRRYLKMGPEGLRLLMESNGLVSEASKPVNNVSSSFVNCSPSKDCAKYCYATGGNYQHTNVIIKSELVTLAVETDPRWAASVTARQYKATRAFVDKKALRLFDKGDMGEGWLPYIEALNAEGIRVQVFSRRPELLRKIPDINVRMLSIDDSNPELADQNTDLPVAYIYSGKAQIPTLARLHKRGQLQVVLPIKQGTAVLTKENVLELRKEVEGIAPYICPIDAGYKPLLSNKNPTGWNCLKCDAKGGLGCFFGQPTKGIVTEAYPKPRDRAAEIEELRRRLYAYTDQNANPLAEAGQLPAGQPEGLRSQIDALLARLMGEHDGAGEVGGNQVDDEGARDSDGPDGEGRPGPRGVRESGTGYRVEPWYYSPLERAISEAKLEQGTGQEWLDLLIEPERVVRKALRDPKTNKPTGEIKETTVPAQSKVPGVNLLEEIDDLYFRELLQELEQSGEKIPKAVLLEELAARRLDLRDVVLVDSPRHPQADAARKQALAVLERNKINVRGMDEHYYAIEFRNEADQEIYPTDDDLTPEVVKAMQVLARGAMAANFGEWTERGGKDYFELLITADTLPAEHVRRRMSDKAYREWQALRDKASEIRRPIFDKYKDDLKLADAASLALEMRTQTFRQVGLPPGYKITGNTSELTLEGPEGRLQTLPVGPNTEAAVRHRLHALAWRFRRADLETKRDEETMAALDAAGVDDDPPAPDDSPEEWRGGHFGGTIKNNIVHVRAKERRGAGGERVLAIEEVQSDAAKQARKFGVRKPGEQDREKVAYARRKATLDRMLRLLAKEDNLGYDSPGRAVSDLERKGMADDPEILPGDWQMSAALREAVIEHRRATFAWLAARDRGSAITDVPFKKAHYALAMRRMLRWAAENGFDGIAWTPGDVQGERYNVLKRIEKLRARVAGSPDWIIIEYRPHDRRGPVWDSGGTYKREDLPDAIGAELAKTVLEQIDAKLSDEGKSGNWRESVKEDIEALRKLKILPGSGRDLERAGTLYFLTPDGALTADEFTADNMESLDAADRLAAQHFARRVEHVWKKHGYDAVVELDANTTIGDAKGYRDVYDLQLRRIVERELKRFGGKVETIRTDEIEFVDSYEVLNGAGEVIKTETARWRAEQYAENIQGATVRPVGDRHSYEWHGAWLSPEAKAGLLKPIAVYEQGDLFGQRPGRDRRDSPAPTRTPVQQGDMFGADPARQARAEALELAAEGKRRKLEGDKSVPADINRPGDLFTRQQDLLDAGTQTRPGTNAKQLSLRERALADLERRLGGARRGVQVAAASIPEDFRAQGSISLAGRTVRSLEELAAVAQVHRDPRFEVLRWIAVKNGVVTHDVPVSARLPAAVMFDVPAQKAALKFYADMASHGSDGWYLLHNHPSGDPQPSAADQLFTVDLASRVPNFRGHVIVDHDSYGVIDKRGMDRVIRRPGLSAGSYGKTDLVPHGLLGVKVVDPLQLATAAKQAGGPAADAVTVMGIANRGHVRALVTIPVAQLRGARGLAMMSRLMRATGSNRLHVIVQSDVGPVRHLLENGVVTDAYIIDTGKTLSSDPGEAIFDETYARLRDERRQNLGREKPPSSRVMEEDEGYGTVSANPIMPAYRYYQRLAQKVIDRWNDKIGWRWDALGQLPRKQDYLTQRYLALGKLTKVREVSRNVYDALVKASPADAQAVYAYLTTAGANPAAIQDANIRTKAVATKRLIDRIGRTLVLRGMLSSAAYAKYKDAYLPRLYLKHILGDQAFSALGSGRRLSDLGYLRRRRNVAPDDRVLLGEILDPAFLASHGIAKTMRDLAIMDFLDVVSGQGDWTAPQSLVLWKGRRVSPFWLKREADSLRQRAELYGPQNKAFAQNVANQMDVAANAALQNLADISDDFEQLPDSPRYGVLRGAWVRKEIHSDLVGAMHAVPADSNIFARLFESGGLGTRITQWWKQSKVALNPPAQVRNFLSNAILVHLSGVSLVRIPILYARALNELRTHGRYWRIARKYGLFESTFSNTELVRIEAEWLDLQRRLGQGRPMASIKAMGAILANKSSDVYQLSESIGKIAKLIDGMEQDGLSESEAMIEAHKWLFDYSLVPKTVQHLRNAPIGVPFLTFYYKATARLAEAAVKHPARFLPYFAIGAMMAAALMDEWDLDDEEAEKLRQAMPDWIREKGHVWILPYKDQHGRWQVFDFGYLLPWGMHIGLVKALAGGKLREAAELTGLASGPIGSAYIVFKTGIDPFTKKPIYPENATQKEQLLALLDYTWSMAAPGFVTRPGWLGKTVEAATGKVNPRTGEPGLTMAQAQLRLLGLNVYAVDPMETRRMNIIMRRRQIEDTERLLAKKLRDRNLSYAEKAELRATYRAKIRQLQQDLEDYSKASAIPRKLMSPVPPAQEPAA